MLEFQTPFSLKRAFKFFTVDQHVAQSLWCCYGSFRKLKFEKLKTFIWRSQFFTHTNCRQYVMEISVFRTFWPSTGAIIKPVLVFHFSHYLHVICVVLLIVDGGFSRGAKRSKFTNPNHILAVIFMITLNKRSFIICKNLLRKKNEEKIFDVNPFEFK